MIRIPKRQVNYLPRFKFYFIFLGLGTTWVLSIVGGNRKKINIARKIMKLVIRWQKNHFL